jgi:hypothetical protein
MNKMGECSSHDKYFNISHNEISLTLPSHQLSAEGFLLSSQTNLLIFSKTL